MGGLRERLTSCERQRIRKGWQRPNLRAQLEEARGRATAAKDRARVAETSRGLAEERASAAEKAARLAEERARKVEAAMVHLTEEVAGIRAAVSDAAAASLSVPSVISGYHGRSVVSAGSPPDFMDVLRTSWEPLQCREYILTAMYESFTQRYRAARDALEPGSSLLRVEEEIGRGGFGGVHKAVCAATGEVWAIKKPVTGIGQKSLIYEILVYRSLPVHPNVLRVHSMYDCLPCPALGLECGEFDFGRALAEGLLSLPDELGCMADVAEGAGHCHDNGIVICDLKPSNVILVHDGARYVGKLADFGLARGIGQTRAAQCGSPGFFPPEVAYSSTLAEPSTDAVAVGAMLAAVALQVAKREANVFTHRMFRTRKESLQLQQWAQVEDGRFKRMLMAITLRTMHLPDYGFAKKVTRPSVLNKMPRSSVIALRNLIRETTSYKPTERPTMAEIVPKVRAVASAVRYMTERAGKPRPTATPGACNKRCNMSNNSSSSIITNSTSMGSSVGRDAGTGRSRSDKHGVSTGDSAEFMMLPPHLLSFASSGGNHSESAGDDCTRASPETQEVEEPQPDLVNAGTVSRTPSVSLTGGIDLVADGGNNSVSAAALFAGSVGAGGGKVPDVDAGVGCNGSDGVPACDRLGDSMPLSHLLPGAGSRSEGGPVPTMFTRTVDAIESVGAYDSYPAVDVDTGGVAAIDGGSIGGPTAMIPAKHPPFGVERGGRDSAAACQLATIEGIDSILGDKVIDHMVGALVRGEEDEESSWNWGWEWKGVRGGAANVGFK